MLEEKSNDYDRRDLMSAIDKLEASRKLLIEDSTTKRRYAVTKIRLHGETVIFEYEGEANAGRSEEFITDAVDT